MPLYDEIDIEDMKWNEKEQCFTYACPCGDLFAISLEDLRAGEEMATCPSCTLFIQVIYNEDDFTDGSNGPYAHLLEQVKPTTDVVANA